jgi:chromosome segregation ATPase
MMETPVQKVVKMLKEMTAQLEAEKAADEKLFKELDCWCKTNKKNKSQELADTEDELTTLVANIEEQGGNQKSTAANMIKASETIAKLEQDLVTLKADHDANLGVLRTEEAEYAKAVQGLKMAITVLKKEATGFLQSTDESRVALKTLIHSAAKKAEILYGLNFKTAFLQASTGAESQLMESLRSTYNAEMDVDMAEKVLKVYLQTATYVKASQIPTEYAAIFKQVETIQDGMQKDLAAKQDEIKQAVATFKEQRGTLEGDLKSEQDRLTKLKKENAEATAALNEALHAKKNAEAAKAAAIEFLANLEKQCTDINGQWAKRSAERSAEMEAVQEAVGILTDDDNREALGRGMAVSFIQVNNLMSISQATRIRAVDLLQKAAKRSPGNVALAQLATDAKLDAFEKVKAAIDNMMAQIQAQIDQEVQDKHKCVKDFKTNDRNQEKTERHLQKLGFQIEDIETEIAAKKEAIEKAKAAIAETETSMKQAGQDREEENSVFQVMVQEQRQTQKILLQAHAKLKEYYDKKVEALMQQQEDTSFLQTGQTPPGSFTKYTKNTGSNTVISLLDKIISESKEMETTGMADEAASQKAYETMIMDSNAAITAATAQITADEGVIAAKNSELSQTKQSQATTETTGENLRTARKNLHTECDFLVSNYDVRQAAQKNEIEALRQAKAILSGA